VMVLLAWPAATAHRWSRLAAHPRPGRVRPSLPGLWPLILPGVGLVAGALSFSTAGAVVGLCAGAIAGTGVQLGRTQLRRRRAAHSETEVVSACRLLVGLLRVGQVPGGALQLAAAESPVLAEAAAAHRAGGSVAEVLRAAAARPGRAGLAELAVAWELAERTGASMTLALEGVVNRQAAASAVAEVVTAELAAPRATGRLLAVLPLAGLLLGFTLGGDPLQFLLGSPVGWIVLTVGVGLACGGVLWTDWLARPEAS
jgi:tight adherence protein B